ncbi:TonB-dependent vitamin B12 receptor BtuB [Enterobacteriaceae bacterium H20N1]|uniref:Vitamin B12 transporter BtuB n=1 Tax=Dryocola boscaweniae TaxID=2925397 RepID=A0A9X2W511_9ENTR|nr:TonB-dependent vitamin B12 receptor BtuB [Dryocola boscaweniae]MCT4700870.1 TonB-dependent vitamin B12 receptor BtuB [Dryocola boscaweniae]MCT4717925.1 TonB-dependent vitamin B12 receptor BtuB [Dryocola boscaweniae]
MIKKVSLFTALSVTAFSGWAQDSNSDDTLVVTANRFQQPVNTVLAPTDVVTRQDIDKWQAKTLNDVMRRLPGVDIAQYGGPGQGSSMLIRGTNASHVLVLIDGVPVARPGISNTADFNQIPLSLVQRVEYIRGPRSAVYGSGAIGGVINVITHSDEEKSQINAGMGSKGYQQYDGTLRQRFGDTVATVAGSYESTKGFNVQPHSTYSGDNDRDGSRKKTFWGGVEHKFNDEFDGFFRGRSYTNNIDYDLGSTPFSPAYSANEEQLYNQSYDAGMRFHSGIYSSQLIASYQKVKDYNYSSEYGRYNDGTTLDRMTQRNLQWGNNFVVGQGSISAGVDWQQQRLSSSDTAITDTYKRDNTGLYLSGQQQFGDVTVEASGREDHDEQFGWHGTWQTAAGWEFVEGYRATVSYGTGFLAPSLGQQFGSTRFGIDSNPNLEPEESKQWEAGLEGLTGPLDWRLSAYRYKIQNLIAYYSDPVTYAGAYDNIDAATIKGVEWTGSIDTGIFTHKVTLQYIDPRNDQNDEVLARRAKRQAKYQLDWTMFNVDMDVSWQYYGKRYDNNTSVYNNTQQILPSYSTVDVSASYPVTSHLTVRGRIANLFDKDYETVYGYQTPGREYYLSGSYTF